jgi:hypothetical protein
MCRPSQGKVRQCVDWVKTGWDDTYTDFGTLSQCGVSRKFEIMFRICRYIRNFNHSSLTHLRWGVLSVDSVNMESCPALTHSTLTQTMRSETPRQLSSTRNYQNVKYFCEFVNKIAITWMPLSLTYEGLVDTKKQGRNFMLYFFSHTAKNYPGYYHWYWNFPFMIVTSIIKSIWPWEPELVHEQLVELTLSSPQVGLILRLWLLQYPWTDA